MFCLVNLGPTCLLWINQTGLSPRQMNLAPPPCMKLSEHQPRRWGLNDINSQNALSGSCWIDLVEKDEPKVFQNFLPLFRVRIGCAFSSPVSSPANVSRQWTGNHSFDHSQKSSHSLDSCKNRWGLFSDYFVQNIVNSIKFLNTQETSESFQQMRTEKMLRAVAADYFGRFTVPKTSRKNICFPPQRRLRFLSCKWRLWATSESYRISVLIGNPETRKEPATPLTAECICDTHRHIQREREREKGRERRRQREKERKRETLHLYSYSESGVLMEAVTGHTLPALPAGKRLQKWTVWTRSRSANCEWRSAKVERHKLDSLQPAKHATYDDDSFEFTLLCHQISLEQTAMRTRRHTKINWFADLSISHWHRSDRFRSDQVITASTASLQIDASLNKKKWHFSWKTVRDVHSVVWGLIRLCKALDEHLQESSGLQRTELPRLRRRGESPHVNPRQSPGGQVALGKVYFEKHFSRREKLLALCGHVQTRVSGNWISYVMSKSAAACTSVVSTLCTPRTIEGEESHHVTVVAFSFVTSSQREQTRWAVMWVVLQNPAQTKIALVPLQTTLFSSADCLNS